MTRATGSVGNRFALCRSKRYGATKGDTLQESNCNYGKIEIVVTCSKQTRGTNSNRNYFRGSAD